MLALIFGSFRVGPTLHTIWAKNGLINDIYLQKARDTFETIKVQIISERMK